MMKSAIEKHFDAVSVNYDKGKYKYSYYYTNLKRLLSHLIPPGKSILEIGCGTGDLLISLKPDKGYGQDISSAMINIAKQKYKNLRNINFSSKWPTERYDYIFMSDVIEHLEQPEVTFKQISKIMGPNSNFINTMANPNWEPLLMIWEKLGWKMPEGPHKRIGYAEIRKLIENSGMIIIKHDYKLLIPVKIPVITEFANRYLESFFKRISFIEYIVAIKK